MKSHLGLFFFLSLLILFPLQAEKPSAVLVPKAPDYADPQCWSAVSDLKTFDNNREVDIFYVYPTYTGMSVLPSGDTLRYMDVYNPRHTRSADQIIQYNHDVFAESNGFNFFGPYYRQITIDVWMMDPEEYQRRLLVAYRDVIEAFEYYWKHFNKGTRPFILQGDSQGSFILRHMLKNTLSGKQRKWLIAAYASGTVIPKEDLKDKKLRLAQDSLDLGVMICYNSVTSLEAICPLFKESVYSINPINWRTDGTVASREENRGAILGKDRETGKYPVLRQNAGAYVKEGFLIVTHVDPQQFKLSPDRLFPLGCLHGGDLKLFAEDLKHNMRRRFLAFKQSTLSASR